MPPLKVVLDTNVVVSATLKPAWVGTGLSGIRPHGSSPPLCLPGHVGRVRTRALEAAAQTLSFPFGEVLELVRSRAVLVRPSQQLQVTLDPDDNVFLECAHEARADYLVTGNKRHFPQFWKSTKIVNARELLELIAPHLRP